MKICYACKEDKPYSEFHKWSRSPDGHYSRCKECRSLYDAENYKNSAARRNAVNKSNRDFKARNRKKYKEYKATLSCTDCGNDNPIVLEFDHLGNKEFNISQMVSHKAWESIMNEISKCEPVCANCHRIRTHNRRMA